jgi:hypothetical protein
MNARYYSPQLGRFISPDPLTIHGVAGDLNPYEYGYGNPARYADPTGLDGNCTGTVYTNGSTTTQCTEDPTFSDDPKSGLGFENRTPGPVRTDIIRPTDIIQNDIDQWDLQIHFAEMSSHFGDTAAAQNASNRATVYANNAIDWAVSAYHIDLSNVSRPDPNGNGITFNPNLQQPGLSSLDSQVTPNKIFAYIGPAAFESTGWLGSSIAHEAEAHGNQARTGTWYTDTTGSTLNEAQAWFYEYTQRGRFGISRDESSRIYNYYLGLYTDLVGIDPLYGRRLNQGNFSPLP